MRLLATILFIAATCLACAQPKSDLTITADVTHFPAAGFADAPEDWQLRDRKVTNKFAGPAAEISLSPAVKVNLLGGVTFTRRSDLYSGDEKLVDLEAENGAFFRVGLNLFFP